MKLTLPALLVLAAFAAPASAAIIAQWTFEGPTPATPPDITDGANAGPQAPDFTVTSGSGTGKHASSSTDYTTPAGNGSANSWSANTWAVGDYWQFQVSTVGFQDITLSWDQTSSGTGPRDFGLYYSTDGTTFTQVGADYAVLINAAPNTPWASSGGPDPVYNFDPDLSSIGSIENQGSVYLRLSVETTTSANGTGVIAAGGTSRVDNFTVNGVPITSVPENFSGIAGLAGAVGLMAVIRYRWAR